ncbi:hypothetical protein EV127DRAFT_498586 [Xylaria flabelliformis]|nr:hypothetical protein EV127DRAFT_498586 [Xylaria flabelliformis]
MTLSLGTNIIVISVVFAALPILAVISRFWARSITKSGLSLDDYFILPGLLFSVAISVNTIVGCHIHLDAEGNIVIDDRLTIFLQVKNSYLPMFIATAISNFIIDIGILSVPIPIVWKLKISVKQKIAISGIFLLGAFYANALDITVNIAPTLYWTELEASIAVISACLPTLRPLFAHLSPEAILRDFASKFSLRSGTKSSFDRLPHSTTDLDQASMNGSRSSDVKLVNRCEAVQLQSMDKPTSAHPDQAGILVQKSIHQSENNRRV